MKEWIAVASLGGTVLTANVARADEQAFEGVQRSVQERAGKTVDWEADRAAHAQSLQAVRRLLRKPLTVEAAVQVALLNNRSLQATFEEIGLSAADLREAGMIPNPTLDLAVRLPDKPPSGTYVNAGAVIDFLSIAMIPLKRRVAKVQLQAAVLRVADETLQLVAEVKTAFYACQAFQQLLKRFQLIVDVNAAGLDLAVRQHEAGNSSDLSLAQQQAGYSRSRLDVAATAADLRRSREKLNRLLGLWGADTEWSLQGELPPVPASDPAAGDLERLAISQRLDLQAGYLAVTRSAQELGLTAAFRWFGALDFGVESERETDAQTRTGPTFAIQLPIFNQGQARIARGEASLRQAQKRLEALAVDVRSQVRELRDEVASKREIARFYQETLLPNEVQILHQSLLNFNAMALNNFELFTAKAEEARTEREYIEAVRDYWTARAELERAVGGSLHPRVPAGGKSISRSPGATASPKD
ncbi:MAG TPA: TolC family protein [Chthoniobacterales bacterium]